MKKVLYGIIAATIFAGCIEVTRGYKSTVIMKVEGESKSTYTASPNLNVNADKDYKDSFKTNTDASEGKNATPEKEESKPAAEEKK